MDEADKDLLAEVVAKLNAERQPKWIDLHNLRIIKYGGTLHLDCHMTVPWYLNVHEAHNEIDALATLVRTHFGDSLELFVHTDGCLDFSCAICQVGRLPCEEGRFCASGGMECREYFFEYEAQSLRVSGRVRANVVGRVRVRAIGS